MEGEVERDVEGAVGRERWRGKVEVNQYQSYPNMHTVTRQWIS